MDLIFFALLWAIFLFAYGVAVEAIRLPGAGADWIRLERIIYTAYWQMFSALDSNIQMGNYNGCYEDSYITKSKAMFQLHISILVYPITITKLRILCQEYSITIIKLC